MGYQLRADKENKRVNDPGYMDYLVRKHCLTGDKNAIIRIWNAYSMVKMVYREKTDGPFPHAPNTVRAGERAIRCSNLTSDPDAIAAAIVYLPASDGSRGCTLGNIRERLGINARNYTEILIKLEYSTDLDEFHKILTKGLPECMLAAGTAIIRCNVGRLLDDCVLEASKPGGMFEIRTDTGLILRQDDPLAIKLGLYYSKTNILQNYLEPNLKSKLVRLRADIMSFCSMAHDASIWSRQ